MEIREGLTFDDVLLAMAQTGGIGVIHRNLSIEEQAEEVRKVKRFESGMVVNPITIGPNATLDQLRSVGVVDDEYRCVGLITVKDMDKAESHPNACKDEKGRLRVAAASTVGDAGYDRAIALISAGADAVVIDTAHGHSSKVIEQVKRLKANYPNAQIIAGNIATESAAKALIEAGADAIKVGIGPGSICTTRIVAGVGVPQLTAIMDACKAAKEANIPVIADGGIKYSGDMAKALAAGAECAMVGSLLAGAEETPGEVFLYQDQRSS